MTPPLTRQGTSSRHLSSLPAQVSSSGVWGSVLLCLMTLTRHLASSEKLDCKSKYSNNRNIWEKLEQVYMPLEETKIEAIKMWEGKEKRWTIF